MIQNRDLGDEIKFKAPTADELKAKAIEDLSDRIFLKNPDHQTLKTWLTEFYDKAFETGYDENTYL